ncbi:MAG: PPOX class F420-dependent oxidoreductase [Chloroflexota bacterium]|nr:PPOX class F420-dependent oxidoreductase [Chloroflexota bacterium]|tara:strand:- start:54 stop:449 length:396 start_codon:yes stop_codon:yes gene_type:complete
MEKKEIDQFLSGIKMAVMATINKDGSPHLSPNWYYYDGERLSFVTTKERLKFFNLRRDDRMSVCVYEPPLASNYVVIQGRATIDDGDIWEDARLIIQRYVEPDQVENYVERWKTQPRILIQVAPDKIYTRD